MRRAGALGRDQRGVALSRIGAITLLQVAALPDPDQVPDCQTLTATCLGESGAAGAVEVTATAAFSEAETAGAGQLLLLEGLTVGKRYRLVVEAISEGPPVAVEASGCAVTEAIVEGENAEVQVIVNARESVTCDAVL